MKQMSRQKNVAPRSAMRGPEVAHFVRRMVIVGRGMDRLAAAVRLLIEDDDLRPSMPHRPDAAPSNRERD